jgi:signal transduction histidine kinase
MNLELDMRLVEQMVEGVIQLNPDGLVTDFNRAARPWIRLCLAAAPKLQQLIRQVADGSLKAPVAVDIGTLTDAGAVAIHLCKREPKGYVLFVTPVQPSVVPPALEERDADFFRLLDQETRHELSVLRDQLAGAQRGEPARDDAVRQATDRVSRLLVAFDQLAQLHQIDAFNQGARLSLPTLIEDVLQEMPRQKCDYRVRTEPASSPQATGVLYGDANWLKCALRSLLEGLGDSAPPHSQIELRVRQNGGYTVLSSHFFHAAGAGRTQAGAAPGASTILRLDAGIRTQICRRILELHGGRLSVTHTGTALEGGQGEGIESFDLVLPISAPGQAGSLAACANCPAGKQAEKYAQDLAFLIPNPPANSNVSDAEMELLAQISASSPAPQQNPKSST